METYLLPLADVANKPGDSQESKQAKKFNQPQDP